MQVKTVDGKNAGTVLAVHDFGAGDLLEIKPKEGGSFYHPFTKEAADFYRHEFQFCGALSGILGLIQIVEMHYSTRFLRYGIKASLVTIGSHVSSTLPLVRLSTSRPACWQINTPAAISHNWRSRSQNPS